MEKYTTDMRIDWDTLWMNLAFNFALRSVDTSTKHGCVIVDKDNKFLSMGYNSFASDCNDEDLPLTRPEKYKIILHSEDNAINNAKRDLTGAIAYITGYPCVTCFSRLLNAKISKIIYGPVGSNCIDESDRELYDKLNISKNSGKCKIEIVKYTDIHSIEHLDKWMNYVKEYKNYTLNRDFKTFNG